MHAVVRCILLGAFVYLFSHGLGGVASGGLNWRAKIAGHLSPHTQKSVCDSVDVSDFPCEEGMATVATAGLTGVGYDLYLMVMDADSTLGVAGASFGIDYSSTGSGNGMVAQAWTLCADLDFPGGAWPNPGSWNLVTFSAGSNCQQQVATAETDGGVTAVLGALYVYAYSPDVFEIVDGAPSGLLVSDCSNAETEVYYPQNVGRVVFASSAVDGYDPCKKAFSPYSEFNSTAPAALDSLWIKFTFLGHPRPVPSTILHSSGVEADLAQFVPYQRPPIDYHFDVETPPREVSVTSGVLATVIDSIGTLSEVTDGDVDPGFVSFSMVMWKQGERYGFESIVDDSTAGQLIAKAMEGSVGSADAVDALRRFGCEVGVLPDDPPSEVTSSASFTLSGYRFDRGSHRFAATMTVKNESGSSLDAPLVLCVESSRGVHLANAHGVSCAILPVTRFMVLSESQSLGAGQSIEVELQFTAESEPIELTSRLYSGPGIR